MSYKQLITPNVNIGASRGWCLKYVDDAVNAPQRTVTAQIAHDTARAKGWVQNNTDFPRNVWFVLFWSINQGAYAGQGHVALAYVNNNGSMQIHDSEVHAGARGIYTSLNEISNWFSASGFQYLGWSIGVDGAKLIEKDDNNGNDNNNNEKEEVAGMIEAIVYIKGDFDNKFANGRVFYWNATTGFRYLKNVGDINMVNNISQHMIGKQLYKVESFKNAPYHAYLAEINGNVSNL